MSFPTPAITDFIGAYEIKQGTYDRQLQQYIKQFTPKYARRTLGVKLYDAIIGNTGLQRNADLLAGVSYFNEELKEQRYFEGINQMLIRWIYFEYNRDYYRSSISGQVSTNLENSIKASLLEQNGKSFDFWNQNVEQMCELYYFQKNYTNRTIAINAIFDNTGTLLITTSDTKYLINGDKVFINGIEYEISNVIDNTSFEITSPLIESTEYIYTLFDVKNIGVFKPLIG